MEEDSEVGVRRASGRVRKQLQAYTSSPHSAGKRKRNDHEDATGDVDMGGEDASDEEESEDGEPDEEEIRERKRQARKPKSSAPKKPASKKPKTNGTSLAIRTVTGGGRKKVSKKAKAAAATDDEPDSLYARVFAGDQRLEEIVADWLQRFEDGPEDATLNELVNFVLKCAGCDIKTTEGDIRDPDGATNRLTDIQDEYQATSPVDYPLVAKGRAGEAFKQSLADFIKLLISSCAAKSVLFGDSDLLTNIEVWFVTMSSAASRAFRHTATIASLAVISALCEVAAENAKGAADARRQAEGERKKQKMNKGRVKQLDKTVADKNTKQEYIESTITDWFDTIFIHRYRDLDPAIRRDCVAALGDWIVTVPDIFFDGQHLRYLGWMLSDTVAATRIEVIKQLRRLYQDKNKIGGLKTFTERFRNRMVEMALQDAEPSVRISAIELLNVLRDHGLLEPDQIDELGALIYDAEDKVRRAIAGFFAENVNDAYSGKIDDLGGQNSLDEVLPEVSEENFEVLRIEWLRFKTFAEMMVAYDREDNLPDHTERNRDGTLSLRAGAPETMFTLAAESLFHTIEDIREWQALAGYLLFDHSAGRANGVANDTLSMLKHECILNEKEEQVLLEVVGASVKQNIVEIGEKCTTKSKLSKKQREDLVEEQDEVARHLASLIPKLLKKFGDAPGTAAAVLRMESVLNLPTLQEIRQDTVTYGALLDDIRKQFMSHGTDDVLGPASEAILHAKSYGELDDLAEEKIAALWEDVIGNLDELINADTITVRGASDAQELLALSNNLLRITRLAQVSNPVDPLEDSSVAKDHQASGADYQGAIDYVIALIERALPATGPAPVPEEAMLEDAIATRAAVAAMRYLQWKLTYISSAAISSNVPPLSMEELEALAMRRDRYVDNLSAVLQARKPGDRVCCDLAGYLLELHSSAVTLKNIKIRPGANDDWVVLIMDLQEAHVTSIWKIFTALEKNFAKLTGKKLDEVEVDIDAEPVDDEPESDSEDDDDDETQPTQSQAVLQRRENKQRQAIIAESKLCELTRALIFAVHAQVIDADSARKRLERNKAKLGRNFKEMLNYLDVGNLAKGGALKSKKARSKAKAKAKSATAAKKSAKSHAIVAEDEEDDEIEDEEVQRQRELDAEAGGEELEDGDPVVEGGGEAESVLGD